MRLPISTLIAAIFISAIFGFYVYHTMPGSRDLASLKDAARVDTRLVGAFRDCMNANVKNEKVNFRRSNVDGHNWAILSAECVGEKAKVLYDAVQPYAPNEQLVRYSDGRGGLGRFFGALYPPSQCIRLTQDAHGRDINFYSCSIRIDLLHEMAQNMK